MKILTIIFFLCCFQSIFSQTIEEKKFSSIQKRDGVDPELDGLLQHINQDLLILRTELEDCYAKVEDLTKEEASEDQFRSLLEKVRSIRGKIERSQQQWREASVGEAKREGEGYALWDQEETTLAHLVMEYGAPDFLYIVPVEMGSLKLNMHSSIPIPRESWSDVLEIILAHNGIGVKKLNAYARQLYLLKQDPAAIQAIASAPEHIRFLSSQTRLFYLFSPPVEQAKNVFQFFERFSDAKQTFVYQIGGKIAVVSSKEEIEKLLALFQAVWQGGRGKVARVVPVAKLNMKEMEKILHSFFADSMEKIRPPLVKMEQEGLTILPLSQSNALVLVGQKEIVDRAEKLVHDTEEQLEDPFEMTVFLYHCRHSDPNDLSKVLEKVYVSLLTAIPDGGRESTDMSYSAQGGPLKSPEAYPPMPPLVVSPPPLNAGFSSHLEVEQSKSDHFIPDPKTGTILMVVRRDALLKIKELLRKLDIPKKMVQIEVLLFEKRLNTENNFGLNLLRIGHDRNAMKYRGLFAPPVDGQGVLQFLFHGGGDKHLPPFDLAYSFLMAQEDIQLNAAPSVITVNQTPATISIVDEISINNGAAPIDASNGTTVFEKTFARAQYGITIILTPTVHMPDKEMDGEEAQGFITLQTNITFDTPRSNHDDRPTVNRRHIENEVRVLDGQTVIIGGLRKKSTIDLEDKVPFLGEIPGLGKLFGTSKLVDDSTEMFFFITPTIILNPEEQMECFRIEELQKRPGDLPEFLEKLVEARDKEKNRFLHNSMKMFYNH